MVAQSKASAQPELKTWSDISLVVGGILIGGLVALLAIWFWFDHQADSAQSYQTVLSTNLAALWPDSATSSLSNEARLMGLPLAGQTSAFWYMARSGGIVAYLLLWLSIVWGLTLSTKITNGLVPAASISEIL